MGWKYYKKFNNIKEILIMDYKNKYNEALERARELSKTITGANYEYIFPELKEDEDELTWLKKYISEEAYYLSMDIRDCEDRLKLQKLQKSLAWLKKQGEQKPQDKSALEAINEKTVDNSNKIVNSKFKVGDWVVRKDGRKFCNGYKFAQITEIDGEKHWFDTDITYKPEDIRLWTIADAEDGDVLVSLSSKHPFIFNGHYDEDTDYVYAYCGISDIIKDDSFYFDKYPDEEFKVWDSAENVRPATRDQRNLLFNKMKDSGYEWDANNKKLKLHSNV